MIKTEQREKILEIISEEKLEELIKKYPPIARNTRCIDITGVHQTNGFWTGLYRVENSQPGHACWLCLHDDGITVKPICHYNFKSGHSSGVKKSYNAMAGKYNRDDHSVDLTGQQYGYIKVLRPTGKRGAGDGRIEWEIQCLACGKITTCDSHTLQTGKKTHCGCLTPYSNDVVQIRLLLDTNNLKYVQEKTYPDCRDINLLPFDFLVEDKYIIEFDGQQHFKDVEHWGGMELTHKHDMIKNKYCFEHNIPLIRIPYNVGYNIEDLKIETTRFLLTPENENKYYEEVK